MYTQTLKAHQALYEEVGTRLQREYVDATERADRLARAIEDGAPKMSLIRAQDCRIYLRVSAAIRCSQPVSASWPAVLVCCDGSIQ